MLVNTYYIETIVLCFSCGCDKGNLNYDNIADFSSTTTQCSMNTPARMILGKQVHWSQQIGDQCDSGGPVEYDLEPIKQLIQLQLNIKPKCTEDITLSSRTPPGTPPSKYTSVEINLTDEIIQLGVLVILEDIETSLANPQDLASTSLPQWIIDHPDGLVTIIISNGEASGWGREAQKVITHTDVGIPLFPVLIDWSKFVDHEYSNTVANAIRVGTLIAKWLHDTSILINRVVLIGFGSNAHTAGITGKTTQQEYHQVIHKIIALSPPGLVWKELDDSKRLSSTDGSEVTIISTEWTEIGFCCVHGTVDIIVNNPDDIQPWCKDDPDPYECSHVSVTDIFINLLKKPILVEKEIDDGHVEDTALVVLLANKGVFHLNIDKPKELPEVPPSLWPEDPDYPYGGWPQIPTDISGYDALDMIIKGYSIEYDTEREQSFSVRQPTDFFIDWKNKHPHTQIVIIITQDQQQDWVPKLKDILLHLSEKYVIIVDWSMYVYPSNLFTAWYAKEVARTLAEWVMSVNVPFDMVQIIGFSTSAHSAGLVGLHIQNTGYQIGSVVGLDPEGRMWMHPLENEKLSESSAVVVEVIHTNTRNFGHFGPLGTHDVYVNGGPWQPHCSAHDRTTEDHCSHLSATYYYIDSFAVHSLAVQAELKGDIAVISGDHTIGFGYFLEPDYTNYRIYVLETDEMNLISLPPHKWLEEHYPPHEWPQIPYNITGYDVTYLDITGFSKGTTKEDTFSLSESSDFFVDWEHKNPHTDIVIIITQDKHQDWVLALRDTILALEDHKYVLIVDWSMYVYPSKLFTAWYAKEVAKAFAHWMDSNSIPSHVVELIGFSTSAHIAGLVGYYVQESGAQVINVVGLDAEGRMWEHPLETEKLSESSGEVVQVVHTNTRNMGHLQPLGTYDVYVNGGAQQPHCSSPDIDECSHKAAVYYYIQSFSVHAVATQGQIAGETAVVTGDHTIGFGYWLIIHSLHFRDYRNYKMYVMETHGLDLIPAPPHTWPPLDHARGEWPQIPTNITGYSVDELDITGFAPGQTQEDKFLLMELTDFFRTWQTQNPNTEIVMIITQNKHQDWVQQLKDGLLHLPEVKYVILVDWSLYVYPSQLFTAWYAKQVAVALAHWVTSTGLPLHMVQIIGFSTNAHIGGLVGLHAQNSGSHVANVIGLDPEGRMWEHPLETEKLSPNNAEVVQVVHTNTKKLGYLHPIGTHDIYVNGGSEQIHCLMKGTQADECSHLSSVFYYIESLNVHAIAVEGKLVGDIAITSGDHMIGFGYWLIPDHTNRQIHVMETEGMHLIPAPGPLWPKEPEDHIWLPVDLSLTDSYNASDIKLIGMATGETNEAAFWVMESTNFFSLWAKENPYSEFIIIITEEPYTDWAIGLREELLKLPDNKYVLIVDWSMYVYNSYVFTSSYALLVAKEFSQWILTVGLPASRVEIIGFSTSSHVAGVTGLNLRQRELVIERIVGLDPAGYGWAHPMQVDKLNSNSANVVQVVHTNTRKYGFPHPTGTHDIYANGGAVQPHCRDSGDVSEDECSHLASVTYYIESVMTHAIAHEATLNSEGMAVVSGDQIVSFGYWLAVHPRVTAKIFALETSVLTTGPYIIPASFDEPNPNPNQPDPYEIDGWPEYTPDPAFMKIDISHLIFYTYHIETGTAQETVLYFNGRMPIIMELLHTFYAKSQVFVIMNGEKDDDLAWALSFKDVLLKIQPDSVVLVIDWSYYKYKSFVATANYIEPIAYRLSKSLFETRGQGNNMHIIGFSAGAHIAGLIGRIAIQQYSTSVARITGLDPTRFMFYHRGVISEHALKYSDASFVDVVHSNIIYHGIPFPMAHADFYINGGKVQPGCTQSNFNENECSHRRSIIYFVESISIQALAVKVTFKAETTLIFLEATEFAIFGYYVQQNKRGSFYLKTENSEPYLSLPDDRSPFEGNGVVAAGGSSSSGVFITGETIQGQSYGSSHILEIPSQKTYIIPGDQFSSPTQYYYQKANVPTRFPQAQTI